MIRRTALWIAVPIFCIAVPVLMYFTVFFSFSSDSGTRRSAREMETHFRTNRDELTELNEVLLEYAQNGLLRIDRDWTRPEDLTGIGINRRGLRQLRKRFRNLEVYRGVSCNPRAITYITHTSGLSVSGYSEGLFYSEDEPVNYFRYNRQEIQQEPFESADKVRFPERGSYFIYIRITGNWYVFNDYED